MLLSLKFMGPLKRIKRAPNESMDLGLKTQGNGGETCEI